MNRQEQGQNPDDVLRSINDRVLGGEMDWGATILGTVVYDEYLTFASGSSEYVDYGNIYDITASDSLSVGIWFNMAAPITNSALFGKSVNLGSGAGYNIYYSQSDDKIKARLGDGSSFVNAITATGAAGAYLDGAWHYAMMVIDRDGDLLHLYMDGEIPDAGATNIDTSSIGSPSTATTLQIASSGAASFSTCFLGEFIVIEKALTKKEAYDVWAAGRHSFITGSEHQVGDIWPLTEGVGTDIVSRSSDTNHGTLVNTPTWQGAKGVTALTWVDIAGLSIDYTPPFPMRVRATSEIVWGRVSGAEGDGSYLELQVYAETGDPYSAYGDGVLLDSSVNSRISSPLSKTLDLRAGIDYTIKVRARRRGSAQSWNVFSGSIFQLISVGNTQYETLVL